MNKSLPQPLLSFTVQMPVEALTWLSVNHRMGFDCRRGHRYVRAPARAWHDDIVRLCRQAMLEQGLSVGALGHKPALHVALEWTFPNRRRRDVDNLRKTVHDAVAEALGVDDQLFLAYDVAIHYEPKVGRIDVSLLIP
ncbi:MAG: RusA family crossover junction endodeoxyribonuclease [Chloroflexota bacterium]